jgi:hypothetical protein
MTPAWPRYPRGKGPVKRSYLEPRCGAERPKVHKGPYSVADRRASTLVTATAMATTSQNSTAMSFFQ